jgi:cell division control protein 6
MEFRTKIFNRIEDNGQHAIIVNRRYLDDEQLIRAEQQAVLEEIFNANVRDREIDEITAHFTPVLRNDHPMHLAIWGKTGTGKTLTMVYFLNLLAELCQKHSIPYRFVQLDLSTPRPCFRALNDLACLMNASKCYKRGISLEELMDRIEARLADYRGYLILFIDEVDNVRRDRDAFLAFLVRRLPQRIPAKLILVFASNRLDWTDQLDPRVKSFLKLNELIFKPYDALDLQRILAIRVEKALRRESVLPGVIEKIAGLSSRRHGDARRAVVLLARSASLAEKAGTPITLETVDQAAEEIEQDRYVTMIQTAPAHLQATLAAVIEANRENGGGAVSTGEAYEAYRHFCGRAKIQSLAGRAFGDLISELDMYSFLHARVESKGRYGRSRDIVLKMSEDVIAKIEDVVLRNFGLRTHGSKSARVDPNGTRQP